VVCTIMPSVTETVKASLLGTSEEPQLTQQIKANFLKHARKDETTGELYMTEEDFVDAIAPAEEDYVSCSSGFPCVTQLRGLSHTGRLTRLLLFPIA
jgi:hypothetical protein